MYVNVTVNVTKCVYMSILVCLWILGVDVCVLVCAGVFVSVFVRVCVLVHDQCMCGCDLLCLCVYVCGHMYICILTSKAGTGRL